MPFLDELSVESVVQAAERQISRMAEDLDELVVGFSNRQLDPGAYACLSCDALMSKARESGQVVKCSVLLATGVDAGGYREILGMHVVTVEPSASWKGFFDDLKARGLSGVYLITGDAHEGIQHAISEVLSTASWQFCRTVLAKNKCRKPNNPWCRPCSRRFFSKPTPNRPGSTPTRSFSC